MGRKLENVLAVLNGLVGDHLARTQNGLETPMAFVRDGEPVTLDRAALSRTFPDATARVVVLVHGLMNTESVWELPGGGDYGRHLARDGGFTPFYVRYNSGLTIAENGTLLASLLDRLVAAYPRGVEELLLLGHSMGGLVIRAACHEAARAGAESVFLPHVRRAIYLGTPHLGAPYERLGRAVSAVLKAVPDPYTRLVADVANLRSAGLQDLGDADLRHEDRARRSGIPFGPRRAGWQHPVPLLPAVRHYLIAGSVADAAWLQALVGDAVVPVPSALARTKKPASEAEAAAATVVRLLPGLSHVALAHHPDVYAQILAWVSERGAPATATA